EPVEAYQALAALTPPGRRRAHERSPFIGRDAELSALVHVLSMAGERLRAHLILLSGDAGVGKSRLAAEIATVATKEHDATVLDGQCMPYGDANVFGPVAEALRDACGLDGIDARDPGAQPMVVQRVAAALRIGRGTADMHIVARHLP